MSDKDFDKIFGDKLREERAFSSVDNDWEQLTARLDAPSQEKEKDNRQRGAAWLWLLLIPIFSLLLWEMNDLKNQNKQLAAQLAEMQQQLATYNLGRDTIVKQVIKTDTVIIYKYLPEKKDNRHKDLSLTKNNTRIVPPSVSKVFDNNTTPISLKSNVFPTSKQGANTDTIIPKSLNDEKKTAELLDKLASLEKQMLDLKQTLLDSKANASNLADCATRQDSLAKELIATKVLVDSLKKTPLSINDEKSDKSLKNNRLFIGIQGGQISYRTTWKNSYGVDISKDIKSYQAGVKLEYAITEKLRLTAEGDFCPFSFTNYWQDSRYNLPPLQFDYQKEKFLKAESKQTLLQSNIGVKYLFTEGAAKWRPFVAAAYTMMRIQPFDTKFTYQPLWGTTNREQTTTSKAVNIPNLILLSGGLEYRFSKHWVAQAEAFYYKDVNKTHKTFDLFGLRAAILLNMAK
jgi:hypothetical protein